MKAIQFLSLVLLSIGTAAHSNQAVTNDLPKPILICKESRDGAIVSDGAKTLTLSRDQFGQSYLTVIQKDQFTGNSTLVDQRLLTQRACHGFTPCESHVADQGETQFFVNYLPQGSEGHLESSETGAVDFSCQKQFARTIKPITI